MKQKTAFVFRVLLSVVLSYFVFLNLSDELYARPDCPENISYTSDMRVKCFADQGFPLKGALVYYGNAWEGTKQIGNVGNLVIDLAFAFVISYILAYYILILAKKTLRIVRIFLKVFKEKHPVIAALLGPSKIKIFLSVILFCASIYFIKFEYTQHTPALVGGGFGWRADTFILRGFPLPLDLLGTQQGITLEVVIDILFWYIASCFLVLVLGSSKDFLKRKD